MTHTINVPLIAKVRYNDEWFTVHPGWMEDTTFVRLALIDFHGTSLDELGKKTWAEVTSEPRKYEYFENDELPSMASKNNLYLKFKDVDEFIHYVPMDQIQGIQTVDEKP